VLIKRFQSLQEERVHTYKLFDEYAHISLNSLTDGVSDVNNSHDVCLAFHGGKKKRREREGRKKNNLRLHGTCGLFMTVVKMSSCLSTHWAKMSNLPLEFMWTSSLLCCLPGNVNLTAETVVILFRLPQSLIDHHLETLFF